MLSFQVVLNSPYMTYEEYSRNSGLSVRTIRNWADEGKIIICPKDKSGETPMVNVVAMTEKATREALAMVA